MAQGNSQKKSDVAALYFGHQLWASAINLHKLHTLAELLPKKFKPDPGFLDRHGEKHLSKHGNPN